MGLRGPGGRASSRRAPSGHVFDHGAQFVLRSPGGCEPAAFGDAAVAGALAPWRGRLGALALPGGAFTARGGSVDADADVASAFFGFAAPGAEVWAGAPSGDALAAHLARPREGLTLATRTRVTAAARDAGGAWRLHGVVAPPPGTPPSEKDTPPEALPGAFDALVAADASLARAGTPGATSLALPRGGDAVPPSVAALVHRMAAVPRAPLYSAMALMPRQLTEVRLSHVFIHL